MKLYDFVTRFRLDLSEHLNEESDLSSHLSSPSVVGEPIDIKLLRMHYFFTKKKDIQPLIDYAKLEVRITDGPDWNNTVAQGKCDAFEHFNPKNVN